MKQIRKCRKKKYEKVCIYCGNPMELDRKSGCWKGTVWSCKVAEVEQKIKDKDILCGCGDHTDDQEGVCVNCRFLEDDDDLEL